MSAAIRVVEFEAIPAPDSAESNEATGAFVNVYVRALTDRQALRRALREVRNAGWLTSTAVKVSVVTAESFPTTGPGRDYYEQCLTDGIVLVLHTWKHER
jgi:hypothetical protein